MRDGQADTIALLSRADAYPDLPPCTDVARVDTHCAHLFLAGDAVWKMKRAVRFSYLDQSTPAKREALCRRELELNRPTLPEIYLDVVPVTRTADGTLELGGEGEPVEWLLHMRRFDEALVLDGIAARGELDDALARELGASVARYHRGLAPTIVDDGAARVREVVEELAHELGADAPSTDGPSTDDLPARFARAAWREVERLAALLDARGRAGLVRRCHGDLHLRNLVLHEGVPVPFDALEFDERMATTDVLYDLAFLLMDLMHRGETARANLVLNAWLPHFAAADLAGLAALPLFVACRAGIRAMTSAQAAALGAGDAARAEADAYLRLALDALHGSAPVLVAVGGFSGSGKSTVAAMLAPALCAGVGAVLLRSDVERKAALDLAPSARLPAAAYTARASDENYARLGARARAALAAGVPVIVDAVFLQDPERRAIELAASEAGVPFAGLWLEAPEDGLERRLARRTGDASDADAAVMRRQRLAGDGAGRWTPIDASGSRRHTLSEARRALIDAFGRRPAATG